MLAARRTQKHPPKQGYISSFSVALRPTNGTGHSCFVCRMTIEKAEIPPFKACGFIRTYKKVKVKQSRYRPRVAQRVPGSQDSQIS